jgi:hypothetical protein
LQGATESNVEYLQAATDREHRHVAVDCCMHDGKFDLVVLGNDSVQLLGGRLLAIAGGIDIAATMQDHRVYLAGKVGNIVDQRGDRWQHQRRPARAGNGLEVAAPGSKRLTTNALSLCGEAADDQHQRFHPDYRTADACPPDRQR